ncbi:energy-coupling factor ABC transporter ATP-binding protein [Levilactobacillus brevis]|jgi:energy-coupling factor transport system ATP-binding protein|uniref:Energy-coupling factor transporter ATP-binding protein EcfA1 n=5 Tax=Levilactobacillus brevis TaxID=1580 RepID=ECFA1_LEVBA|nr:energy-coupling factor ABC transporter ATP-binding protein [Levilactobacillus brevis]Q03PY5.1 RecName: Full=Energy-coupling factor transporter ATP-binding protein EcfA1; Short=ECF transporter A component EcfA1 [Levilactobacillus brevis ATCC 367]4HUQ_B Chain B, Energy-coupling factor transporter ATP-binding protein EcfA 2 [Levilactobacillus brevis ATCC 367]4HZU_A Chain A, Energy-coupling factor transporter ATP-binding protein EcfA 2 [Levilactobacillus brevis]4RFS_B Chain B, Energy-coupling fa
MTENIISVDHLTYQYDENQAPALTDVSFTVHAGEWLAIVGHNGSGKSTLAKSLDGLLPFTQGSVTVGGITLTPETVWQVREQIGMIFQNPDNQFVGATVEDDVAFGLENRQISRDEMVPRVQAALAQVGMTSFAQREPSSLSGGQKQRVALAGIVAIAPKILILDEATSMLDPQGRIEMLAIVRQLRQQQNLTVISITHDIDEAASADRVLVIDDGRLVDEAVPSQIFERGTQLVEMGLDLPFTEKLKAALRQRGITPPTTYQTAAEMEEWLWQSLSNT